MSQSAEEQQERRKQKKDWKQERRKRRAIWAVASAALVLLAVPVLAWLYMQRSMETITEIKKPEILSIKAGDMQDIEQLELGTIDVSGDQRSKDVVFCVYSAEAGKRYYLQLAHTTNIGFTYSIYKSSPPAEDGNITYLGKQYQKGESLPGGYLNLAEDQKHATNAYHDTTYKTYNHVQQAAEPLYWKSNAKETLPSTQDANGEFYVNYYILHISWGETVQNNKETDMIYLMAG
ncbi:MAG: hypothetical protein Q4P26_05735 [Lachnospiraceae bacterium]|nr:hypothetical protein [Lachnospiraceae bacterium]